MTESQRKNAESQRKTPDREKVIKVLEQTAARLQYGSMDNVTLGECEDAVFDALDLLREQGPVKPRWTHPAVDINVMMCGSCGIEIPLGKPNYCPWCGRQVKWNDAE